MSGHRVFADMEIAGTVHEEPDPGASGAITAKGSFVNLITTGAETRTLGDPGSSGLFITLHFLTDGGDCVVTTSSPVNVTGNNTLTFADATDLWLGLSIRDGAGTYAWREIQNDGVALSTV